MILKFILKYSGNNGVIEKFFIRIANEMGLEIGFERVEKFLIVYVKGNEEELTKYSDNLSKELPLSIFMESVDAEVTENFVDFIPNEFPKINLSPCPRCLKEVKDENNENYYNPFHHCEICGYQVSNVKTEDNYKTIFENIANELKEKGEVAIQTMNGKYKLNTILESDYLVAKDLDVIANYFVSFEGDAKALGSIEKPYLRLKTNYKFKQKFKNMSELFYVKLPDDMILNLLFDELEDIELLSLTKVKKSNYFEFDVKEEENIVAVVTDTKHHIIIPESGERSLIPQYCGSLGKRVLGVNSKFGVYSDEEKTIIDLKENLPKIETKEAEKNFAGFLGVLNQWKLEDKITVGYTFYKEEKTQILLNSPKFGLVEYLNFDFKFASFEDIFARIKMMDETGPKLIKNYMKKENQKFMNALDANLTTQKQGIAYLWGLIGIILGFDTNIDKAYNKLMEYSNSALTKKGPRIDYKMDGKNLNPLWAIRTAMSFKLAGVDDFLISFGVIESFAEFLNTIYETLSKEMDLSGAILVGDMFEGDFLNKTYTNISKNYPTFTPKSLPMSGAIEAYGSAVINSKV
jgi:hypothetical protein